MKINHKGHYGFVIILKIAVIILFLMYLACLIFLTIFSRYYGRGSDNVYRNVNLLPFKTILQYAISFHNRNTVIRNLVGNVLAFVPMGFLIPLIWKKLSRFIKILLISILASITIEAAQYILGVGASDIDDVILNTIGGILGFGFYYLLKEAGGRFSCFTCFK